MSFSVEINSQSLQRGLERIKSKAAIEQALMLTGMRIAADAVLQVPRPPIKWGVLRGSVNVATEHEAQLFDPAAPGGKGSSDKAPPNTVRVSFNTEYAAKLHEARSDDTWPSKQIDPGSGRKFLSSKIQNNGQKYAQLFASFLKQALRI